MTILYRLLGPCSQLYEAIVRGYLFLAVVQAIFGLTPLTPQWLSVTDKVVLDSWPASLMAD